MAIAFSGFRPVLRRFRLRAVCPQSCTWCDRLSFALPTTQRQLWEPSRGSRRFFLWSIWGLGPSHLRLLGLLVVWALPSRGNRFQRHQQATLPFSPLLLLLHLPASRRLLLAFDFFLQSWMVHWFTLELPLLRLCQRLGYSPLLRLELASSASLRCQALTSHKQMHAPLLMYSQQFLVRWAWARQD